MFVKQHLFYTFLFLFVLTAIITLLGVTNVLDIRDQYLAPLVGAFLLELAGAVIALYRGARFFEHDEPLRRAPNESMPSVAKLQTETVATPQSPASPSSISKPQIESAVAPLLPTPPSSPPPSPALASDLAKYFDSLEAFKGRYHEQQELRRETNGKHMNYIGHVGFVKSSGDQVQIMLHSPKGVLERNVAAFTSKEHETAAFALRQGDIVEAAGKVDTDMASTVILYDATFHRLAGE